MLQVKWKHPEGSPPPNLSRALIYSGIFCAGAGAGVFWVKYRPELAPQLAPWLIAYGIIVAVVGSILSRRNRNQGG
jgi:hypothetical protein